MPKLSFSKKHKIISSIGITIGSIVGILGILISLNIIKPFSTLKTENPEIKIKELEEDSSLDIIYRDNIYNDYEISLPNQELAIPVEYTEDEQDWKTFRQNIYLYGISINITRKDVSYNNIEESDKNFLVFEDYNNPRFFEIANSTTITKIWKESFLTEISNQGSIAVPFFVQWPSEFPYKYGYGLCYLFLNGKNDSKEYNLIFSVDSVDKDMSKDFYYDDYDYVNMFNKIAKSFKFIN